MPSLAAQALSLFQSILLSLEQSINHDDALCISNYYINVFYCIILYLCVNVFTRNRENMWCYLHSFTEKGRIIVFKFRDIYTLLIMHVREIFFYSFTIIITQVWCIFHTSWVLFLEAWIKTYIYNVEHVMTFWNNLYSGTFKFKRKICRKRLCSDTRSDMTVSSDWSSIIFSSFLYCKQGSV